MSNDLKTKMEHAGVAKRLHYATCQECNQSHRLCAEGLRLANEAVKAFNNYNRSIGGGLGPYAPPVTNRRSFA